MAVKEKNFEQKLVRRKITISEEKGILRNHQSLAGGSQALQATKISDLSRHGGGTGRRVGLKNP
jgi:hypothetical protein